MHVAMLADGSFFERTVQSTTKSIKKKLTAFMTNGIFLQRQPL